MIIITILIYLIILKALFYFAFNKKEIKTNFSSHLAISIIVPMYNERILIRKTVNTLLEIEYFDFEIIVVDDGSTDDSLKLCIDSFENEEKVKILSQRNKGKAEALNNGIKHSKNSIIVCIDADTLVKSDVLERFVELFNDESVAAVSGQILVGNSNKFLSRIQYYEYIFCQNLERDFFGKYNSIITIPGAIAAFRKNAILSIGGFFGDTLTEDSDLSLRLLIAGYKIQNSKLAMGFTESPIYVQELCKQRRRWNAGLVQVLSKHFKSYTKAKNIFLTFIVIPYSILNRFVTPGVSSIADYLFIFHLIYFNSSYSL